MLALQALSDRVQPGRRLAQSDVRFQTRDYAEAMPDRIGNFIAGLALRQPEVGPTWKAKIRWKDTDYCERLAVELDGCADQIGIRIEVITPQFVADHCYGRGVGRVVRRLEG